MDHKTFRQLYFIADPKGMVPMDFIGRFENLQVDFNMVCAQLGIENMMFPQLLVRTYSHYTKNYTSRTKDLVYGFYKHKIDYFGFEFAE